MGIFDYVVLPEELARRLGRYGCENYQTKYGVEDGYVRVYNGFRFYRPFWETLVWVELLVRPKSVEVASREPLLATVQLEELGIVEKVEVRVLLTTTIYGVEEIAKLLGELGFEGPRESEEEELEEDVNIVGSLSLEHPVEVSVVRVKDESAPFGVKTLLRLRSRSYEITLPVSVMFRVSGRQLIIEKREHGWRKYRVEEWAKNLVLGGREVAVHAMISYRSTLAHGYHLTIEAKTLTEPDIGEADIDAIVEYVEDIPKQLLKRTEARSV